jgi:glycosyltransferase involved in cell wall biosynthesis
MNRPLLTAIVPVYNTAKYLRASITSLLLQTHAEIQIVAIDDGSTDESVAIIRELASTDSRIQLICQSHKGPGAARNTGLDHALGDYIACIDSDDVLLPTAFSRCVDRLELGADMICFSSGVIDDAGAHLPDDPIYLRPDIPTAMHGVALLAELIAQDRCIACPPFYVTRASVVLNNGLRFLEGTIHEDEGFTPLVFCCADRAVSMAEVHYQYRQRSGSIIQGGSTKNESAAGYIAASAQLLKFLRDGTVQSPASRAVLTHLIKTRLSYARLAGEEAGCPMSSAEAWRMVRNLVREMRTT